MDIEEPAGNRSLEGKKFIITAEFRNTTREVVKKVCTEHGGVVTESVTHERRI